MRFMPAVDGEGMRADGPGDLVLGVVVAGMLPGDPAVGHAVGVQRQDQWMGAAQPRFRELVICMGKVPVPPRRFMARLNRFLATIYQNS